MKNPAKHDYDTLIDATQDMKSRGYTLDFNTQDKALECKELDKTYPPVDFEVKEWHRFEGMSNPSDSSIIYAIETSSGDKGTLIDAYGAYDSISPEMADRLKLS